MWVTPHIALIVPCVLTIKLEFRAYISLCRCYDYKMNVVVTTGFASQRLLRTCITSLTSHITSLTSYCDFSRQGQHLVMLEWHFSWKVQYLVTRDPLRNLENTAMHVRQTWQGIEHKARMTPRRHQSDMSDVVRCE